MEACKEAGMTLICIPYSWDKQMESLRSMILAHNPGLIHQHILSSIGSSIDHIGYASAPSLSMDLENLAGKTQQQG